MSAKRDYYEVLGIGRSASLEEIKRSYRRLARQYHPDVNSDPGAEEKFKELGEAYQVLSDPEKRAAYDAYGHAGLNGGAAGPGPGFGGFDLGDILNEFFGGGMSSRAYARQAAERGADLRYDVEISLEEAASGVERVIEVARPRTCDTCTGSGAKPGTRPETCPSCGGTGQIRHSQQTILGAFSSVVPCGACRGAGRVIKEPCRTCGGQGRKVTTSTLTVRIPAGIEDGTRVQVRGEGESGVRGGPPGDLYVYVSVREHERFQRRGRELRTDIPISFSQAALGDTIKVPTLYGEGEITIPAGTQTGTVFRIRDAGMPSLDNHGRGDLHVTVHVVTPTKLTDRQKELFRELAGEEKPEEDKGFLGWVRDRLMGD